MTAPLKMTNARSATEALALSLEQIDEHESTVHAFVYLDEERAKAEAQAIDARPRGPLVGLTLGVKDIFDTADQPTSYGSIIHEGYRPHADAGVVAMLRAAGAVCVGKTVTAEFAMATPGATRNPHRLSHTPGGSSQGSAAGVACEMFDIALGTQTAGSVLRPASFCGIYGFKPTKNTISTAGVKPVSQSLDTVGWFARSVELLDEVHVVLTHRAALARLERPYRLALYRSDQWPHLNPGTEEVLLDALARGEAAGGQISERPNFAPLDGLTERARTIMAYEARRSLAYEFSVYRELLSERAVDTLELGENIDPKARDRILDDARSAGSQLDAIFGDADVLVTAAATGEAPEGISATGDPRFCQLWTLLGYPALSVPGLLGPTGLPIGVQLVGRPGHDAEVIAAGAWLGGLLDA